MGILTALDSIRHAPKLVDAMRHADELAFEASREGGLRTVRVLKAAIADDNQLVAIAATHALSGIFDEDADRAISKLLSSRKGFLREHAAWALGDMGIEAVIAPSFSDIFSSNAFKNGIVTVVLPQAAVDRLMVVAAQGDPLHIDLEAQTVTTRFQDRYRFEIDAFRKACLLGGIDEIGLTLASSEQIANYEARTGAARPWLNAGITR